MFQNLSIKNVGVVLLITLLLTPAVLAENEVEKPKELEVGMIAPNFTLKDETGTERSLNEFFGKKKLYSLFIRKILPAAEQLNLTRSGKN